MIIEVYDVDKCHCHCHDNARREKILKKNPDALFATTSDMTWCLHCPSHNTVWRGNHFIKWREYYA